MGTGLSYIPGDLLIVIPVKTGIQSPRSFWIPPFVGMTISICDSLGDAGRQAGALIANGRPAGCTGPSYQGNPPPAEIEVHLALPATVLRPLAEIKVASPPAAVGRRVQIGVGAAEPAIAAVAGIALIPFGAGRTSWPSRALRAGGSSCPYCSIRAISTIPTVRAIVAGVTFGAGRALRAGCAGCSGRAGGASCTVSPIRTIIAGITFGAGRANRALRAGGTLLTIRTVSPICAIIAGITLGAGRASRAARPFRALRAGVTLVAFGAAATPRPPFTLRTFRAAGADGILVVALRSGLLVHYLGGGAGWSRIAARSRFTLRSPLAPLSRFALWTRRSGRARRTLRAGLRRRRRIIAALKLRRVGCQRRRFRVAGVGFGRFQQAAAFGRDDR